MNHTPCWITLQTISLSFAPNPSTWVLQDFDWQLHAGERVALLGANGSGKTTLLRLLAGLIQPQKGHIIRHPDLRVAMVFQKPWFMRWSVHHQLRLGLYLAGWRGLLAQQYLHQAIDQFQLAPLLSKNTHALSGGQQQRLSWALAWLKQPQVWLLDEPTAHLDAEHQMLLESYLIKSFDSIDNPTSLVFSTHQPDQAQRLATRVVHLGDTVT